jgi:hypothetical protein
MNSQATAMQLGPGARDFACGLMHEHLDEAGWLFEHRLYKLEEEGCGWTLVADFERRMEAHLAALTGGLAQTVQETFAALETVGTDELFVAAAVACRSGDDSALRRVLSRAEDAPQAIMYPLIWYGPEGWARILDTDEAKAAPLLPFLLKAAACRRLMVDVAALAVDVLGEDEAWQHPEVLWSAGRRPTKTGARLVTKALQQGEDHLRHMAARAFLRVSPERVYTWLLQKVRDEAPGWALVPIAMAVRSSEEDLLRDTVAKSQSEEGLLALGVLGRPVDVPLLIDALAEEALVDAAAQALNLVTGAELYEEVFVPEEIDETELFEEELEKLHAGEPLYAPGEEPGELVTRLSHDAGVWQDWWTENRTHLATTDRLRYGRGFNLTAVMEGLRRPTASSLLREFALDEAVIRERHNPGLETVLLVRQQEHILAQAERYAEER